jgi:hypothetical protein
MIIAAFDMGTRNFAFCVEYIPDNVSDTKKPVTIPVKPAFDVEGRALHGYQKYLEKLYQTGYCIECQCIDILEYCKLNQISNIYLGLTQILNLFSSLWDKVDVILIEQQMAYGRNKANIQALRLSQHCLSYFHTIYGPYKTVLEWASTHKTRILGCPIVERRTHKSRKQFSIQLASNILKHRNDPIEPVFQSLAKQDDVSDCLLMIQAYKVKKNGGG